MGPIRLRLASIALVALCLTQTAAADIPMTAEREVVARLQALLEAEIGQDAAYEVMATALAGTEVSERQLQTYGDGLLMVFFTFDDIYGDADNVLTQWLYAVWDGRYTERAASQRVAAGLDRVRHAHEEILHSIPTYLRHIARVQVWRDRARLIASTMSISGEGCRPYYRALNMANLELARARAALPHHLRGVALVPSPDAEPRGDDLLQVFIDGLPDGPVPVSGLGPHYDRLLSDLLGAGVAVDDPVIAALRMAAAQAGPWQETLPLMMTSLGTVEGEERDRIAAEAAGLLAGQVAELSPLLQAAEGDDIPLETAYTLADMAQRLAQLHDDLERRGIDASPLLRGLSGLRAALMAVQIPDSGEEAERLNAVMADLARFAGPNITPTAPMAVPAAIAAGLIDVAGDGYAGSAETLDHLARYLETGDPADYRRMLAAAERVQQILEPHNFLRQAAIGAVEGIVSNVPGLRSLFGRHIEDLAEWALDSDPYDWEASYDPSLLGPRGQGVCPAL